MGGDSLRPHPSTQECIPHSKGSQQLHVHVITEELTANEMAVPDELV